MGGGRGRRGQEVGEDGGHGGGEVGHYFVEIYVVDSRDFFCFLHDV